MDSLITAAAQALAAGDLLGVLKRVSLREDPPALALRGMTMARLGDFERAKSLLKSAARAFGPREDMARARCVVAEAEIALVSRDLGWPAKALAAARATLEKHGDWVNAAHARHLEVRRLLLIGRLGEAERTLAGLDPAPFPPASRAAHELVVAGIAIRRLRIKVARPALTRAKRAARQAGIAALMAEVENASVTLNTPAARLIERGEERLLLLEEVEEVLKSEALVVDACRHVVRGADVIVSLTRRPVLFALARVLGETWPKDVSRDALVKRAFRAKHADESHRARLRVEIGRLRAELRSLASVSATTRGFTLAPRHAAKVAVLAPPVEDENAAVLAFLADGESWSSSALALALGTSQRTVQRALDVLAATGKVQSFGRARTALDDAARGGIHDDIVTPGSAARCLGSRHPSRKDGTMKRAAAEILREYGPFPGVEKVHGLTFDGENVWFATGDTLHALNAESGKTVRAIDVAAHAGTAFDGQHLFQIAEDRIQKIDPDTGRVLATIPAPGGGSASGLAWAEGSLWVGQYRDKKIRQVDPETGAIIRTIDSNRFVTGVTWVDGELWHGTWEGDDSELRRIDPRTGEVLQELHMPPGTGVSGLESDGGERFFCGGGPSGKVRAVRRPKQGTPAKPKA